MKGNFQGKPKKYTPRKVVKSNPKVTLIKNVVKQRVPTHKIDTSEGITKWEVLKGNNDFPQQLIAAVENSPCASSAMDVWHEFTEGNGFEGEIGNIPVNKDQNLNDLHSLLSKDISMLWGVAVHISYDLDGNKKTFRHIPFESCRLGELDEYGATNTIKYNPYYGTSDFDKKYTKTYYSYTESKQQVIDQIKAHQEALLQKKVKDPYPGQIFWFSIEQPMSRVYPKPFYYSSMNWFRVDEQIQLFHERNIQNNFMLSVMINKYGDPDTPAGDTDKDGNYTSTVGEETSRQMKSNFGGAENAGSVWIDWFLDEKQKASIQPFPNNANHDLFVVIQDTTTSQIAIGTKVPRVLLGIGEAGKLGDTQEIINAIRVMQSRTRRLRKILASYYVKLFSGFIPLDKANFDIKNINPVDILPEWAFDVLTTEEKRKFLDKNFNVELIEEENGSDDISDNNRRLSV